jgi:hypothetical protein
MGIYRHFDYSRNTGVNPKALGGPGISMPLLDGCLWMNWICVELHVSNCPAYYLTAIPSRKRRRVTKDSGLSKGR